MAVAPPWTEIKNTPNKSVRQNVPRKGVVLHHAVLRSLDELIRLEMGAKQVSSTAVCLDNRLPLMVPDGFRAWSLSDGYWDSALRSVETCNQTLAPDYKISDESHWSLARAVAYWADLDGFWPHRDGDPTTWTVIGHGEVFTIHDASYATACPGGMDLDLVVRRAQQILNGTAPAGGGTTPINQNGFLMALTDDQQREVYAWLKEVQLRVRGDNPDADMLQEIRAGVIDTAKRVRGDDPKVDMLQKIQGIVSTPVTVTLNDAQTANLAKATAASIAQVMSTNQAALIAEIQKLPPATVAAFKAAL